MKRSKLFTALLIAIAVCAATLVGIGVASGITFGAGDDDDSTAVAPCYAGGGSETVSAVVDTYWNAIDDEGDDCHDSYDNRIWTQNASEYRDACAPSTTARLIRNGVDVALLTFDGEVDTAEQSGTIGGDVFSWKETSPWHIEVAGLPKRSSDGSTFTYLIVQDGITGFLSETSERGLRDDGSLFARFYNHRKNSGSSASVIPVSACWKDGGDVDSRNAVKVGLYAARDISFDGSLTAFHADNQIATTELNEGNSWYAEFSVPVSGLSVSKGDFYICELSTYDSNSGVTEEHSQGRYRMVSYDEARLLDSPYRVLLNSWDQNDTAERMIACGPGVNPAYRVSYEINRVVGSFEVTNQRVGSTDAVIEQNWLDVGSDASRRPANSFALSATNASAEFVYPASGEIYSRLSGLSDFLLRAKDASGNLVSLVVNKNATIDNSRYSLSFGVDSTGDSSSFTIVGLPKYDAQGFEINWEVKETWVGEQGDYQIAGDADNSGAYAAVPTRAEKSWHQEDKLTFSFTNKLVGTKSVTYHAKWFDHFVRDGDKNQRPELSLKLYRQKIEYAADGKLVGSAGFEEVPINEDGITCSWSASDASDRVPNDTSDGDFTKYVTIAGLPKYDDHGKMYAYYACPSLSSTQGTKDGVSYSYELSFTKDNYMVDSGSWDKADSKLSDAVESIAIGDSSTAFREDATFNFHIKGVAVISGEVKWMGIPEDQASDLPDVSVYAQRRLAAGSYDSSGVWTEGPDSVTPWLQLSLAVDPTAPKGYTVLSSETGSDSDGHAIDDGQTAVAWTSDLNKSGTDWSYSISALGDSARTSDSNTASKLDAFDSDGRLYEYRVREVVDGVVGSAAFDSSKFANSSTGGPEEAFAKVYGIAYAGNSITNSFCSAKGSLTVDELFEGSSVCPDTSFKLYRFSQGAAGKSELKLVSETVLANYRDGNQSVVFTGLETYTLAGEKWDYVPVEVVPDHFSAKSAMGSAVAPNTDFKSSAEWAAANGVSLPADETDKLSMGPAVEFDDDLASAAVTFMNSFDSGTATLAGSIDWDDRDGIFGSRPAATTSLFKLTRACQDGSRSEEVTLQSVDANAANYLVWTAQSFSGANTWTYEIRNLAKTAPDLKPWRYTLTEDLSNTQYKLASDSSGSVSCNATTGEFPSIVNELKGQVGFTVAWNGDSDVRWLQRPAEYVSLQAREAGTDSDWANTASFFAAHGIAFSDSNEFEIAVDTQVTSTAWGRLPLSISLTSGQVVDVEYRVVASRYVYDRGTSKLDVSLSCAEDGTYSIGGGSSFSTYMPVAQAVQPAQDGLWKYEIVNMYQGGSTDAKAAYVWSDGDNSFNTRPTEDVLFALQRSCDAGVSWQWVDANGAELNEPFDSSGFNTQLLAARVSSSASDVSVDGLPLKDVGSAGVEVTYQYRLAALVSGSYKAANSSVVAASADNAMRLETVELVNGSQYFAFELLTKDMAGKVSWNDYGSGLCDSVDLAATGAKLKVSCSVAGSAATDANSMSVTPAWNKDADGAWSYSLKGLPKLDSNGREYIYSVVDCDSKMSGWHFAGSDSDNGIAFAASRLAFDSVDESAGSDGSSSLKLNGASFELSCGSNKVATWSRTGDGAAKVSVEDGFGKAGAAASDGWIIGLPAGEYTVHETTVPTGYQSVADFVVTIGADGTVTVDNSPSGVVLGGDGFTVTVDSKRAPVPSVPSADSSGGSSNDDPQKPEDPGADGGGDKFVSEPTLDIAGCADENGIVTPVVSATFVSADGKSQLTLSTDGNQLEIELVDLASGTCKVKIKPGCEPAGYKGDLLETVVVNLFEGKTVSLEKVQKATGSKSGYALCRGDDGVVYKVIIPKDDIKVVSPKKTFKASSLKKGKKKFTIAVIDPKGKVTYKSHSKMVVVSKSGVVTVKKGAKRGTYKITVTSRATDAYAKVVKTVKFKVR